MKGETKQGRVSLIGAGPGDPDLLTLRAARYLASAEILLYDRLVDVRILELAGPRAERIYVGKAPGENSRIRQERIFALMIGHARAGREVVRLKGGDPFVFGRGSEELLVLHAAGIAAEVVPGISAALAAPGAAGIPVTHRGLAAGFGVFTGHGAGGAPTSIDWTAAARSDTAVFLMGVERLGTIVKNLIEHGRPADEPVAVIERATRADMRVATGTLEDIQQRAAGLRSPATIVVGKVVGVRTALMAEPEPSRREAV